MNPALDIAAARAFAERWTRLHQLTSDSPDLMRPAPVLEYQPGALDLRPQAAGRDPCPRCNIRGDLGCAHQSPAPEVIPYVTPAERLGRRRYDRRSMGRNVG